MSKFPRVLMMSLVVLSVTTSASAQMRGPGPGGRPGGFNPGGGGGGNPGGSPGGGFSRPSAPSPAPSAPSNPGGGFNRGGNSGGGFTRPSAPSPSPAPSPRPTPSFPSNPGGGGFTRPSNPGGNSGGGFTRPSRPTPAPAPTPAPSRPSNPGGNPGGGFNRGGNNGGMRPGNPGVVRPSNPGGIRPGNPGVVRPGNPGGMRPGNPGMGRPHNDLNRPERRAQFRDLRNSWQSGHRIVINRNVDYIRSQSRWANRYSLWQSNYYRPAPVYFVNEITWYEPMPEVGSWDYTDAQIVATNLESLARDIYDRMDRVAPLDTEYGQRLRRVLAAMEDAADQLQDGIANSDSFDQTVYDLFNLESAVSLAETTLDGYSRAYLVEDQMKAMRYYVDELLYQYRVNE